MRLRERHRRQEHPGGLVADIDVAEVFLSGADSVHVGYYLADLADSGQRNRQVFGGLF